jgi:hypothetical protein
MRQLNDITWEDAFAVRDALVQEAQERGVRVVVLPPNDPRRELVLAGIAGAKAAGRAGWDAAVARERLSVTVPGLGTVGAALVELVKLIPVAGMLLGGVVGGFVDHTISMSPAAYSSPVRYVGTLLHEFVHVWQIDDGGVLHCARYVLHTEHAMLGAEAPAAACEVAMAAWTGEATPTAVADAEAESLRPYGANDAQVRDARRMLEGTVVTLEQGGCPPVRPLMTAVRVLRARGVAGLPPLP